ncbi:flagellar biosynthetic protein FliQ [Pseudomonas sp. GM48]|uniref:flagellar biosynthetic protein FliQ n=1 Tax=Pseudomonas sp. GM48 TaxID=1144330 RepID=UPI001EE63D8C
MKRALGSAQQGLWMTQDFMLYALKEALLTAAMVAAPLLLAILIVGLLVSILQVATQIQEMTLTFIPKLIVTVVMLLVFGNWMLTVLKQFALSALTRAASF